MTQEEIDQELINELARMKIPTCYAEWAARREYLNSIDIPRFLKELEENSIKEEHHD